ncbi:MAG TPA: SUF system NifU family Fe-S cluster assembly protein [Actinotalea caeni]|uniref:Fe-S cluster assembly sulfur transfer protein SufU n=1 Tax=Actinotalea caeni TaxID=1348467 RepID=UPI002B4B7B1E|nr:SUF system NifU family Fe-S cluster assembly protein [Actinotalea caeni]HLV55920.1 SUF system NifU family Fe-S cluster assembly protein [Actinotalea caeni]
MSMEQLYQQLILDHARERHGHGLRGDASGPGAGESFQVNPTCGDEVRLRVRLSDDGTRVADVSWEGVGCSISQASTSVLSDVVTGAGVEDVESFAAAFDDLMHSRGAALDPATEERLGDAAAFAGVSKYPARVKCALLGWMALRDALIKASKGE